VLNFKEFVELLSMGEADDTGEVLILNSQNGSFAGGVQLSALRTPQAITCLADLTQGQPPCRRRISMICSRDDLGDFLPKGDTPSSRP